MDGSTHPRSRFDELLTSSCPYTSGLMGFNEPTSEDHTRLVAENHPTGLWFSIWDRDGAVEINEQTAVLMAKAILKRVAASKARAA